MNLCHKLSLAVAFLLLSFGCSTYVTDTIPPVVDLRDYAVVAVLDFPVKGPSSLQDDVTHRYLATLQAAQPGVRILELGSEQKVLGVIGARSLDIEAIRQIGEHYGVDALLTGEMTVTTLTPSVSLNQSMTRLDASSKVKGALNAKLRETATGATMWTNGAHGTWTLGGFSLDQRGLTGANVTDLNAKYEAMLDDLLHVATCDFRPTYRRRKVD